MAYQVEPVQDHGCVQLTLEGPITCTELELVLYETYATLERRNWDEILLEVMRIEDTLSMPCPSCSSSCVYPASVEK